MPNVTFIEHDGTVHTVEAELGADGGDRLAGGIVAGNDRSGIARREPQQEEHEQRHHRHDGQHGEDAAGDVGGHATSS